MTHFDSVKKKHNNNIRNTYIIVGEVANQGGTSESRNGGDSVSYSQQSPWNYRHLITIML
jgi:hypothetical protein